MSGREQPGAGLSKSFMRGCVLLLLREQPSYGYDLLEGLQRLGLKPTDRGGLYRTLRAMEQEGLLRSTLVASEMGPERRIYNLTEEGEQWLHGWAELLRDTQWTMRKCLRRYDALYAVAPAEGVADADSSPGPRPNERVAASSRVHGAGGPTVPIALIGAGWTALGASHKTEAAELDPDSSA